MLVRSKEGKFFEIDEETLKGKEVEAPPGAQQSAQCGEGGPMQMTVPGGQGGSPLIVINVTQPTGVPPGHMPGQPSQQAEGAEKEAQGRQCYYWCYIPCCRFVY
jgi:hypothetical protein